MPGLPLIGIRVLDFTWVVAGPVATRILADHGVEVIKLERKPGPPGERQRGLQGDLHRNKLSIAVNMANPRGVEVARRLAATSDLVMDNFSARVMRGWGMDYTSLCKIKPDIICISMSGLGHTGPRASYVSYGPTLQALGGFTRLMAEENGQPAGYGYSYADMAGGYTGALAALIALWHRRQTGRGQFIDLSQFEALVSLVGPALLDISVNGRVQSPPGYLSQEMPAAPDGVYKCRPLADDDDRWLAISVRTQPEWERFVAAIGSPEWAHGPEFRTLFLRIRKRERLDRHIGSWTIMQTAEHAMELLQDAGVAAGVVSNGADICARDLQLR
ncbi:MAG: CoA transferase, partial [Deltaproteobacteria bacterium]|nr:CoA transferase [Deltaproteobacteria bacterium]